MIGEAKFTKIFFLTGIALIYMVTFCYEGCATVDAGEGDVVGRAMGHGDAADLAVARVNGVDISMAKLMTRMLELAGKGYGRREITPLLAEKIKDEALVQLITGELAFQVANRSVTISNEEVAQVVEKKIAEMGGEIAFQKYLEVGQANNKSEFVEQIRRLLILHQYIKENIEAHISITEADLMASYNSAQNTYFKRPEVVQVAKIIFFLDPALPETYSKIAKIKDKIISELAGDPTKLVPDGSFIVQEDIKLSKDLEGRLYEAAKKLDKFGLSDVLEKDGTLYLLQLTGYQPAVNKSFEEVRDYLRSQLFGREKDARLKEWMDNLSKDANVEIIDVTQGE